MKLTFLVPPVLDHNKPAERTAGCTRIVYAAPNIYELTVVAVLEQEGYTPIYRDFVYYKTSRKKFEKFLKEDDSDIYYIWTVNLSIENDLIALSLIRKYRPNAFVVFMGPGPTYFTDRFFTDEKVVIVRGERMDKCFTRWNRLETDRRYLIPEKRENHTQQIPFVIKRLRFSSFSCTPSYCRSGLSQSQIKNIALYDSNHFTKLSLSVHLLRTEFVNFRSGNRESPGV